MNAAFSIFLVGMMGAGKSTVGVRLARRLGLAFIDADRELEARLGVDIPTIFELEGEAGFRRRETQLLDELSRQPGLVLATGGGAVLSPHNRECLHARGRVVYLQAQPADLWQRLRRDRQRPLLRTPNPRERIHRLCAEREPLYLQVAHHVVPTSRQPVEQIVEAIVELLGAEGKAGASSLPAAVAGTGTAGSASLHVAARPAAPPDGRRAARQPLGSSGAGARPPAGAGAPRPARPGGRGARSSGS